MRILHTADLHLGNIFYRHSRIAEHKHFLQWLLSEIARREIDALIISGDIFDHPNPGAEVQRLFFDFLTQAVTQNEGLQIVVIAGNHDSGIRLEAPEAILRLHNIYICGCVPRDADNHADIEQLILPLSPRSTSEAAVVCYALPFLHSYDYPAGMNMGEGVRYYLQSLDKALKKTPFRGLPIVVAAHFYAAGAMINAQEHSERLVVGGQDMVEATVIDHHYAYTALGHIHRAQEVDDRENVRYAGSPIPLSFGERGYHRSVVCVDIDHRGGVAIEEISYTPLCSLLSLPERGAATPEEALRLLAALPTAHEDDDTASYPFMELNVSLSRPEPTLRHQLLEALQDKAVRFCRITTAATRHRSVEREKDLPTVEGVLQNISPIDLAGKYYRERFDSELPETLAQRFHQAEQSIED